MPSVLSIGHFPFCCAVEPTGKELKRAMSAFWRVRRWQLDVTMTYPPADNKPPIIISDSYILDVQDQSINPPRIINDERGLVCLQGGHIWSVPFPEQDGISIGIGNCDDIDDFNIETDGETDNIGIDQPGPAAGQLQIEYAEFSFAKTLYRNGPGSQTCEASIRGVEYWPYDDGTGPTYNTETGRQLRFN